MYHQQKKRLMNKTLNFLSLLMLVFIVSSCQNSSYTIVMYAKSDYGISEGSEIILNDKKVGIIDEIEKSSRDSTWFSLSFYNDIKLPKDTKFIIGNSAFLGENFIYLSRGENENDLIETNDTVSSILKPKVNFDSYIEEVIEKLDSAVRKTK